MALTGLLLCGFLFTHLLGNLTLLVSEEAFNTYAHTLTSNPLILVAEGVLALLFFSHIALGVGLTLENRRARGSKGYQVKRSLGPWWEALASQTMIHTGLWTLVFLLVHIVNFRLAGVVTKKMVVYGGVSMADLYGIVMEHFQSVEWTLYYLVSMVLLGVHLSHGFASAFQSLGLNHSKYNRFIGVGGKVYSAFITIGFSAVAIFCHLKGGVL